MKDPSAQVGDVGVRAVVAMTSSMQPKSGKPQSTAPTGAERRVHARAAVRVDISLHSEHNFYQGFTEDVSTGGLFVATYDLKPLGTEIELSFELPTGYEVKTIGIVRWVRDTRGRGGDDSTPGMGLQYASLSAADRDAIESFIAARSPMFFDEDE